MSSVTQRINEIKQPRGGYINPSQFDVKVLNDGKELSEHENIHATVIGITVDYLTRLLMGTNADKAFSISLVGAKLASSNGVPDALQVANDLLSNVKGLDDKSIISACKLTTFDVWFRNTVAAPKAKNAAETNPDKDTIKNIQTMVKRSADFWSIYGPIVKDGFTFEPYGYTQTVDSGDGDFLTQDTMWDFKVLKSAPTNKHTLQLLMYWIMGQHSDKPEFKDITAVGIFNPRLNTVYTLPMSRIELSTIKTIETEVICY